MSSSIVYHNRLSLHLLHELSQGFYVLPVKKSDIFQELQESKDYVSSVLYDKAGTDLMAYCEALLCDNKNDRTDDWIYLSKFYRTFDYLSFMNLLFRYDLSVDNMQIEERPEIASLYDVLSERRKEKTDKSFVSQPITSGMFLASSQPCDPDSLDCFNIEIAPYFYWVRELLQFYFME